MITSDPTCLSLGRIVGTKTPPLAMTPEQRRTHMHVLGSTGSGKSKFLEHLIRQDILEGRGLCLIDPHGELARDLLAWVSRLPAPPKKFHYIAPHRDDWTLCYNPLRRSVPDEWFLVNALKIAVVKCWGADNTQDTPRLDEWLKTAFFTAVNLGLTLPEVGMLLEPNVERNIQRRAILQQLPETQTRIRGAWEHLCLLAEKKPIDFDATVGSTTRRLAAFLDNPRLNRVFGIPDFSLDLRQCMDEGAILLVDLSPKARLHPEDARLFGTLLLTDFYVQMFSRERPERAFTLYVDEFQNYATKDLARMLDEARKFGLQLVLSHQRPGQLQNADSAEERDLYSAVMTNARTKVVFGGVSPDELEPIARLLSMGMLDPKKVKEQLWTRGVVDYRKEYWQAHSTGHSISHTSGSSHSTTRATMGGSMSSGSAGTVYGPNAGVLGPAALHTSESSSWSNHFAATDGYGDSWSDIDGDTDSESTTTFPVLVPVLGEQLSAIYYETIDEQLYQFMAVLTQQQQRQAMLRIVGQNEAIPIEVPYVRSVEATPKEIQHQLELTYNHAQCYLPVDRAQALLYKRQQTFLSMAQHDTPPRQPGENRDTMKSSSSSTSAAPMSSPTSNTTTASAVHLDGVQLQARDFALLADVYDSRFITIPHATAMHFEGSEASAKRRLAALAKAELLAKTNGRFGSTSIAGKAQEVKTIYAFTKKALDLLIQHGYIRHLTDDWNAKLRKRFDFDSISPNTIAHEVGMLDIKAAMKRAIAHHAHLRAVEIGVWPLAYEFSAPRDGRIIDHQPDGFLHVAAFSPNAEQPMPHYFYIEFDRGTETLDTIAGKVKGYREHLRSGAFMRWLGVRDGDSKDYPFRVLFIIDSKDAAHRRDNIAQRLTEIGVETHTPITTFAEFISNPLDTIWLTPKNYAEAGGHKPTLLSLFPSLSTIAAAPDPSQHPETVLP
jgi:hypothetical protein